jgi:hypothetical protein
LATILKIIIAKFGYTLDMKVETNIILLWLPIKTHHKNMAYLGHFFYENSFVKVEIIFFMSKFGEIFPKQFKNIAHQWPRSSTHLIPKHIKFLFTNSKAKKKGLTCKIM